MPYLDGNKPGPVQTSPISNPIDNQRHVDADKPAVPEPRTRNRDLLDPGVAAPGYKGVVEIEQQPDVRVVNDKAGGYVLKAYHINSVKAVHKCLKPAPSPKGP